jgi:glycosyltransferase involved in cell wall biosynthesis
MIMRTLAIDASRACRQQKTGVEWYAYTMITQLKTVLPKDVRVLLYTDVPDHPFGELPAHWEVRYLSWPPKRLWTQLRLRYALFRDRPDMLFVPAHVPPLRTRIPTVMMVHDLSAQTAHDAYSPWERWYSVFTVQQFARQAAALLVPSQYVAEQVKELCGSRCASVHVVPHGYTHQQIVSSDEQIDSCLVDSGISTPFICAVGRIEHKKNIQLLLDGYAAYRQQYAEEPVQLVLAGKPGHGYGALTDQIASHPYTEDIVLLGYVDDVLLQALYARTACFAFLAAHEGFGLPVLEAMDAGAPVLGVRAGSVPEVGGDAIMYTMQTADAVATALDAYISDPDLRQTYIARGHKHKKQFDWRIAAEKTADILLSL